MSTTNPSDPSDRSEADNIPDLPQPLSDEVTCRQLIDSLMAYLDGELDEQQSAALRQHLDICPSCVNYTKSYRSVVDAAITAIRQRPDAPDRITPELVASIFSHGRGSNSP